MAAAATGGVRPKKRRGALDAVSLRRLGIIIALLSVVIGLWAWRAAAADGVARYLQTTDAIQSDHTAAIEQLNTVVAEFSGEPTSAVAAAEAFRGQADEFETMRAQLAEATVPAAAAEYATALDETYAMYVSWCEELAKVADYIAQRGRILTALSDAITSFDARIREAASNEEVIAASVELQSTCDNALREIRSLDRPSLLSYSSAALEANVSDLSATTGRLAAGVESLDAASVSATASELRAILARDWALAVQESDLEGSERYTEAQVKLAEQEQRALEARGRAASE